MSMEFLDEKGQVTTPNRASSVKVDGVVSSPAFAFGGPGSGPHPGSGSKEDKGALQSRANSVLDGMFASKSPADWGSATAVRSSLARELGVSQAAAKDLHNAWADAKDAAK